MSGNGNEFKPLPNTAMTSTKERRKRMLLCLVAAFASMFLLGPGDTVRCNQTNLFGTM